MPWRILPSTEKAYFLNPDRPFQRGLSLVELVVAGFIGAILSYAAYSFLHSRNKASKDFTNRLAAHSNAMQFLDLRKKALSASSAASSLLGTPDMSLPPEQRVYSGIQIPRQRVSGNGSVATFTETFQTVCATAPQGLTKIDPRIHSCLACASGTLPVISAAGGKRVYPLGDLNAIVVSAALCVQRAGVVTTLRLLSLVRNQDSSTTLYTEELAVSAPIGAPRFQVLK